jgi:autotransporter-associated beta strand protein
MKTDYLPPKLNKITYLSLLVSSLIANNAYADCTLGGNTWSCSGANQTQTVGSGQNDNGKTVNVGSGATISVGDMNAISLGDNATITNDGTIANNAVRASGDYGTGANTIEVKNNATITNNGTIRNRGTENYGETINVHGFGNTIINNGTIETERAAALWFQDWSNQIGLGGTNKIVNNGTITRADGGNVIGTSAANNSAPGIDFTNNGLVNGNLIFAGGNDKLTFLPGSSVTGNINGGGTNSLLLDGGNANSGGELTGAIKNFTTLTKIGTGIWTVSGPLQGFTQVTVQEGNLTLTGNNDGFNGNLLVISGAGLEARAQSLPTNNPNTGNIGNVQIQSNANLVLNQNDNGTYIGQIVGDGRVIKSGAGIVTLAPQSGANLYTGSTAITDGGISISSANALGSGALAINQGSLITTADMTLNKAIYLASAVPNATAIIDTEGGSTLTLTQGLQGVNASGTFLKTGNGVLALEGDNTYLGAVNIDAGTLRVSSNSANNLTGQLSIVQNARLEGTGTVGSTTLATINGGTIAPGSASDMYGTLTIRGDYSGQPGSSVDIHTQLSDDNSPAGKLVIEGSTGYIPTSVRIIDNWGSGAYTTNGIPIIEVHGNSDPNAFRLDYHYKRPDGTETVIAGNYLYQLKHIASGAAGT